MIVPHITRDYNKSFVRRVGNNVSRIPVAPSRFSMCFHIHESDLSLYYKPGK